MWLSNKGTQQERPESPPITPNLVCKWYKVDNLYQGHIFSKVVQVIYLIICMPGGVIAGGSGLCCCLLLGARRQSSTINLIPFISWFYGSCYRSHLNTLIALLVNQNGLIVHHKLTTQTEWSKQTGNVMSCSFSAICLKQWISLFEVLWHQLMTESESVWWNRNRKDHHVDCVN